MSTHTTATKTIDIPNTQVLHHLVYHAIQNNWPFGCHYGKDTGWTLAIPADRYGEFIRLRETLREI